MLREDKLDSAQNLLHTLTPHQLNQKNYAYYNLLSCVLQYKLDQPFINDSTLRNSLRYFHENGDYTKESMSLFYLGMISFTRNDFNNAIINLKQAENILPHTHDDAYLKNKIYSGLVAVNYVADNDSTAFKYAFKELKVAREENNAAWMSFAYNHLACLHAKFGSEDSAYIYISRIEPLIQKIPKYSLPDNLTNIAIYYLVSGDTLKAERYALKSYNIARQTNNTNLLANLMILKGDTASAVKIWNEALRDASLDAAIKFRENLAAMYYNYGDDQKAARLNMEVSQLKDSLNRQETSMKIQAVQLDYDHQKAMQAAKIQIIIVWSVLIAILIIGLIIIIRTMMKARLLSQTTSKYQSRISTLERKSDDLEVKLKHLQSILDHKDTRHSKEMSRLRKEIDDNEIQRKKNLTHGKVLYDSILAGKSIINWTKDDFNCLFEYYDIANPNFTEETDKMYSNLSYGNRLLLIMENMGLDSKTICFIMGISAGSLRSARSRLKAKKIC